MKNLIKKFCIYLLLGSIIFISAAKAKSSYDGPSYSQMDTAITRLSQTYFTLENFKNDNERHLNQIKSDIKDINHTLVTNLSADTAANFNDVRKLSQNELLMLEAAYTFTKQNEAQAGLYENSLKTLAFEKCLEDNPCTFEKLNKMLDEEALNLAVQAKRESVNTQKDLLEKISTLNDFILESENSRSLSNSIKILSKINLYQGQLLTRISEQLAMLENIEAHKLQLEHQNSSNQTKAGEQFFNSPDTIRSEHLDISLNG